MTIEKIYSLEEAKEIGRLIILKSARDLENNLKKAKFLQK